MEIVYYILAAIGYLFLGFIAQIIYRVLYKPIPPLKESFANQLTVQQSIAQQAKIEKEERAREIQRSNYLATCVIVNIFFPIVVTYLFVNKISRYVYSMIKYIFFNIPEIISDKCLLFIRSRKKTIVLGEADNYRSSPKAANYRGKDKWTSHI